jgi:SAM-dependent methyltransferase
MKQFSQHFDIYSAGSMDQTAGSWTCGARFPCAFAWSETMTATPALSETEASMFAMSDGYELYMGRWSRLMARGYAAFAGLSDGERILDVGTGTGALASTLESMLPGSEITGVDPSAGFIAGAKNNAKSSRLHFEVGDAQMLRFGEGTFDHAMSLLVINFIPDHEKAVAEMRRVTRSRGIVSACAWDYGEGMESLRIFWDEAVAVDPAAAPKHERNMKLTREGDLGALWKKAGLRAVREKPLVIDQAFSSFGDYWGPFLKGTGPGGAYVASLSEERRAALEQKLRGRLLGGGEDRAFTLKARAWCAKGEVP